MKMSFYYQLVYRIVWLFFYPFHPVRVVGKEHIPEGSAVICANHSDLSDPLFLCFAFTLKYQIRPMAKIELSQIPVIGKLLEKAGVIYVDRGNADVHAVKAAMQWLRNNQKLLVFPEGTRVHEGEAVSAKSGAALFATRTNSPILPVYISRKKYWFRPTPVIIGEPYSPQIAGRKATSEELETIANDMMDRIYQLGGETE